MKHIVIYLCGIYVIIYEGAKFECGKWQTTHYPSKSSRGYTKLYSYASRRALHGLSLYTCLPICSTINCAEFF